MREKERLFGEEGGDWGFYLFIYLFIYLLKIFLVWIIFKVFIEFTILLLLFNFKFNN